MIIKADTKTVNIIDEEKLTSGAFNNLVLDVELSDEYQGLTTFVTFDKTKTLVIDNKVALPTLKSGKCRIGVYAIDTQNDKVSLRYSPAPAYVYVRHGSYKENLDGQQEAIIISEAEKIYSLVSKAINDGLTSTKEEIKDYNASIINPVINTDSDNVIELKNNVEYRRGTLESLTINYPETVGETFFSSIVFCSGTTATTVNCDERIKLVGNNVSSNTFTPEANKVYELRFWWNGANLNCVVWGV